MTNYYLDTEYLPLLNWRMVNDKADLTYVRKDRTKGSENEDIEAWNVVLDSYYKEFGILKRGTLF
jgi:hypothetical protein